ncbi:MAG: hypothetical protein MUF15_19345 [Acidobacteria bacterium]|jgi:hypothetical protein|nr:hypothetical protein [Acidobacteriota bacterium]
MKKTIIFAFCLVVLSAGFMMFGANEEVKPNVKVYGYLKLDALYETGNSSHGNYIIWAKDPGNSSGLFYVTARETRVGVDVTGFSFGKFKVTGKLEVDFHSAGTEENKPYNYMRHAFLEISNGSLTITAGQTWDIISPLVPATLNYSVLWGVGNIGYRRPQLSIRKDIKTGRNVFTIQGGIFRTIASDYDSDGIEDGSAAGFPTFQGRIAGKFGLGNAGFLQLGVSGHYGKSEGLINYTSDSLNADMLLVLSPKFKIIAEYFSGKNLGTYMGGIIQSINATTGQEVKANGFYVNAVVNPSPKLQLSLGYSMDDPEDADLTTGSRSKNTSFFGNFLITLSPSIKVGFEVSDWITDYLSRPQQKTVRFQNSWILYF